jgi:hypothetical protein
LVSHFPLTTKQFFFIIYIYFFKKKKVIYVICKSQLSVKEGKENFFRKGKRQIEEQRKINLGRLILKVALLIGPFLF